MEIGRRKGIKLPIKIEHAFLRDVAHMQAHFSLPLNT